MRPCGGVLRDDSFEGRTTQDDAWRWVQLSARVIGEEKKPLCREAKTTRMPASARLWNKQ